MTSHRPIQPQRTVASRFVWTLALLIVFPFPLDVVPGAEPVVDAVLGGWTELGRLGGSQVLGLREIHRPGNTGSGDTTEQWLVLGVQVLAAALLAVAWSVVEWNRLRWLRVEAWMREYLRLWLAYILGSYGLHKLFPNQMPLPDAVRLTEAVGELSPMGLLWTSLGAAPAYQVFAGTAEMVAALLLLPRRTTTLGALAALAVMLNVMMLNFTYDVPVKLYSLQLVLAALVLAGHDARGLFDFFVRRVPATPRELSPLLGPQHEGLARWGGRFATALVLLQFGTQLAAERADYHRAPPESPLSGAWDVLEHRSGTRSLAAGLGSPDARRRWRRYAASAYGRHTVRTEDDSLHVLAADMDTTARRLALFPIDALRRRDSSRVQVLHWTRRGDTLELAGRLNGDTAIILLRSHDVSRSQLLTRGFHWVQEQAYNR